MGERRRLALLGGIAAATITALLVVSTAGGTAPQYFSGAVGGFHPSANGTLPAMCCDTGMPCKGRLGPVPSYCCWCNCYYGSAQKVGMPPQIIPCALEGDATYCRYCPPPPCTGICPMGSTTAAGP